MVPIRTVPLEEAEGKVKEMYDLDIKFATEWQNHRVCGQMPIHGKPTRTVVSKFLHRMTVTLRLPQGYVVLRLLAHGALLRKNGFDAKPLRLSMITITRVLTPQEVARWILLSNSHWHVYTIQFKDVQKLRDLASRMRSPNVAMASAMRNFYSKITDALGVEPDNQYWS